MFVKKFIKERNLPQNTQISAFFALLALFWIYPLTTRTIVSKLLLPSVIQFEIITAVLCAGIILGIFAIKECKNIYPLVANIYILLIYTVFLQYLGKPGPTYLVILTLIGVLTFISIAIKKIYTNSPTTYELYSNISKYSFFLSLTIKALRILPYQTHSGDINILAIIILIAGTILGFKAKKANNLWLIFNILFLIVSIIDSLFVLPFDVLFRFL